MTLALHCRLFAAISLLARYPKEDDIMKKRLWFVLAVFGMVAAIQGCALKPQNLRIDPPVKVNESAVGTSRRPHI